MYEFTSCVYWEAIFSKVKYNLLYKRNNSDTFQKVFVNIKKMNLAEPMPDNPCGEVHF